MRFQINQLVQHVRTGELGRVGLTKEICWHQKVDGRMEKVSKEFYTVRWEDRPWSDREWVAGHNLRALPTSKPKGAEDIFARIVYANPAMLKLGKTLDDVAHRCWMVSIRGGRKMLLNLFNADVWRD